MSRNVGFDPGKRAPRAHRIEELWLDYRQEQETLFSQMSRSDLGTTQNPTEWTWGIKRSGNEAEVKN